MAQGLLAFLIHTSRFGHSITTCLVADSSFNCDQVYSIGYAAANAIKGQTFPTVKLRRIDKVKNISGRTNTVKIRCQSVVVKPALLFNRITCILKNFSEM